MRTDLLRPSIEDMPIIIDWDLYQQLGYLYEVRVEQVRHVVPSQLQIFEVRPGIGLCFCGYNDYKPGNIIYDQEQPRFDEITRFILVQPDLSIDMPIPRFTFFVHRIGSNNPMFVKQEIERLHLPSWLSPSLRVERDDVRIDALAVDSRGPVHRYSNTGHKPIWRDEEFYGQYYTVQGGKLWFGVWYWAGEAWIHQRRGDGGGAFAHDFLDGMDETWGPEAWGRPYMQITSRPGADAVQIFFAPRCLGGVA